MRSLIAFVGLAAILIVLPAATYIFTAPTCTTIITSLKACALYAEFQHFIPKFNKILLFCGYY